MRPIFKISGTEPTVPRIIEEELIDYRIRSRFSHRKYVKKLGLAGDERILEFGSGGGSMSRAILPALDRDRGGSLTCVDISGYWIEKARKRLGGHPAIEFREGDIRQMDFSGAQFDLVLIHFVLHDIDPDTRVDVIDALVKTLRPEGNLVIDEPARSDHGMPLSEIRALMRNAGMREIRTGCTRSFRWKWTCGGTFRKSW